MLKKLALAVMMVCGAVSAQNVTAPATLDPSQTYSTGNIVQQTTTTSGSTWVNGMYQDQLTCWAWGNPGYCGPNPIVRPGNNINFSFGWTDLYQQQAIASVLPSSGTGLRVNGYNFGFSAKNGNGWDDGRADLLFAYVQFNDTQGGTVLNHTHNLSYQFNWTTFNYSKTFDTPFAAKDLGSVRYGFVGKDNNNWAGPYGPEIMNVSFGLTYSVDPCIKDPLYSPTCPGYMEALNKLLPPVTAAVEPSVTSTPTTASTSVVTEPVTSPTTTSVSTAPSSQPSVVAPVVSAPAPSTSSSSTTASSTTTSASSSANNREVSGANTAQALSIISRNQERDRETLSVAQTAVSAAAAAAAAAQQEATAVATAAVANSTNNNAVSNIGSNNAGTGFRSAAAANNSVSQSSTIQLMSGVSTVAANAPQTQPISTVTIGSANATETAPVTQTQSLFTTSTSGSLIETNVAINSNFLTDRTNPINNIVEQRSQIPTAPTVSTTGPSVNTRASDNEAAAGGVSIATMAVAPVGYGDYLNFTLRDAAFYAPREVYRNQRNVDNQRALRLLTNDSRHREMVEQQYRR